jgi:DNA-binding transcriptional MerR regulator
VTAAGLSSAGDRPAAPDTAATTPNRGAPQAKPLRIGEVAELTGTTPRTIRYWEELGLLGTGSEREEGKHRSYDQAEVQRVSEIVRLRNLLGLSLEQLSSLLEAESARAHLRRELSQTESPAERRRILEQLLGHISGQLELVRGRLGELNDLARELETKQTLVRERMRELDS